MKHEVTFSRMIRNTMTMTMTSDRNSPPLFSLQESGVWIG